MKLYELTYLPVTGLSEDEKSSLSERVVSLLGEMPISQHSSGFMATLGFNTDPEKINAIEENLRKESRIQRFLLMKKVPVRFKARVLRRAEFSSRIEKAFHKEGEKPKVELQEIEKKLDEILKD